MLVVGGDEHELRVRAAAQQTARDLEPGQARHLHVEHHQIRRLLLDDAQRLDPVVGLCHDLDAADLAQQEAQLLPRQLFIVDDDRPELVGRSHRGQAGIFVGTTSSGITMRAQVPSARHAVELELVVRAVDDAQPLVDVPQADAAACRQVPRVGLTAG